MSVKQYYHKDDVVIITTNIGGNWIPKYIGCKVIHLPSRKVFESTELATKHDNLRVCLRALNNWLHEEFNV